MELSGKENPKGGRIVFTGVHVLSFGRKLECSLRTRSLIIFLHS